MNSNGTIWDNKRRTRMKNYHFLRNIFSSKKEEDKNHFLHSLNGSKHLQQDDRCQDDVGLCLLFLKNFLGRNLSRKFDLPNSTSRHDGQLCWRVRVRIPLKFLCQLKVWKYLKREFMAPEVPIVQIVLSFIEQVWSASRKQSLLQITLCDWVKSANGQFSQSLTSKCL